MNRRALLATTAGLLGGCVATGNSAPEKGKLVHAEPLQSPGWLQASVEMSKSSITEDHTAEGTIEYTNTGSQSREFVEPKLLHSESDDPGIVLFPSGWSLERSEDGCWKLPENLAITLELRKRSLESGESYEFPFEVWANWEQTEHCIVPGTYVVSRYGVDLRFTIQDN